MYCESENLTRYEVRMKRSNTCQVEFPDGSDRENREGSFQKVSWYMCEHR